jgi:hypothetical protein
LNDGERTALLNQYKAIIKSSEAKLAGLGLANVRLYAVDDRSGQPVLNYDTLVDMAEGKCVCGAGRGRPHVGSECPVEAKEKKEAEERGMRGDILR